MLGSDIISDVRTELLEQSAGFWSDAELLTWLNRGELDFSNKVRGLEATAAASTVVGRADYPLPANWLSAVAIYYNNKQGGVDSWRTLRVTDLQELSNQNPNFLSQTVENRGTPSICYIWDRTLYLYPVPDTLGDGNIKMFFKAKPVALTSASQSINIDDSLSHALRHYILWQAWRKEKEFQLASEQEALYRHAVREGLRSVKLQALNKINNVDVQANSPFDFNG